MKKIALTGDRPTGRLHLGHYVGSLKTRLDMQHDYDQYIMIADIQALTDNFENPKKVAENVFEVAKDYVAIGLDPNLSTFFIQSQIPELTELTIYYLNLVSMGRLERNPTVKDEIKQRGFGESLPVGFFCYPVSQAADISIFKAEAVPVGDDQAPMVELTNEIVRRFNRIYNTNCLKEAEILLSNTSRLVGIDGNHKASKSLGNAIYLSDEPEEIKRKVFMMYTDPNHLKVSDPGSTEGNVVFTYLDAFHENKTQVDELKAHYRNGGLGDTTIKSILNDTLQQLIEPMREKRKTLNHDDVVSILKDGTKKARRVAIQTMEEVRAAIGLSYF